MKPLPEGFQQKIPDKEYRGRKRGSVFQKVDFNLADLAKMPKFEKSEVELKEIIPILKTIMLTKNLGDQEMNKLANCMKPEKYKVDDILIRYGDPGQTYYILARGSVKVIVYNNGTNP